MFESSICNSVRRFWGSKNIELRHCVITELRPQDRRILLLRIECGEVSGSDCLEFQKLLETNIRCVYVAGLELRYVFDVIVQETQCRFTEQIHDYAAIIKYVSPNIQSVNAQVGVHVTLRRTLDSHTLRQLDEASRYSVARRHLPGPFRLVITDSNSHVPSEIETVVPSFLEWRSEEFRSICEFHRQLVAGAAPAQIRTLRYVMGRGVSAILLGVTRSEQTIDHSNLLMDVAESVRRFSGHRCEYFQDCWITVNDELPGWNVGELLGCKREIPCGSNIVSSWGGLTQRIKTHKLRRLFTDEVVKALPIALSSRILYTIVSIQGTHSIRAKIDLGETRQSQMYEVTQLLHKQYQEAQSSRIFMAYSCRGYINGVRSYIDGATIERY